MSERTGFPKFQDKRGGTGPLLYMTVDVGGGRQDGITIYPDDQPADLARAFCAKLGLDDATREQLQALIAEKKEAAIQFRSGRNLEPRPVVTPSNRSNSALNRSERSSFRSSSAHSRSHSSSSRVSEATPRNYGEWLYQRDKRSKERKRLTFRSESEKRTSLGRSRGRTRSSSVSTEDNLIQKGVELKNKIRKMREDALEEEKLDCTFRPEVNPQLKHLNRSASPSSSCFEKLYSEASSKESRQSDRLRSSFQAECPFHPTTVSVRKNPETQKAMVQRLLTSKQKFESVVEKLREELESGTVLSFKPMTGRAPHSTKYTRKGPVHEHLYDQRAHKQAVVQKLSEQSSVDSAKQKGSSHKSQKVYEEYLKRQVQVLFSRIDLDRDGTISFRTTDDLRGIDGRTALLLGPIWKELLETQKTIDLHEFTIKIVQLMRTLSQEEKTYLLKRAGGQETPTEPSSHQSTSSRPTLSKTSEQLASRRKAMGKDVYTRRTTERSISTDRLRTMKEEKDQKEMKECTFRPALTRYKRKIMNSDLY